MLVLSRKKNESIVIDDKVTIVVVEIRGDKVRIGVEAPKEVPVQRREVYDMIHNENSLKPYERLSGKEGSKVIVSYPTLSGYSNIEEKVYVGNEKGTLEFISLKERFNPPKILSERVLTNDLEMDNSNIVKYSKCDLGIYTSTQKEISEGIANPEFLKRWELLKRQGYVD